MNTSAYVSDPNQWVDPLGLNVVNGNFMGSAMGDWGRAQQSKAIDQVNNPQKYTINQHPIQKEPSKIATVLNDKARKQSNNFPSRQGTQAKPKIDSDPRRNPKTTPEQKRKNLENMSDALTIGGVICTATGVGSPLGAVLGGSGTAIGTYVTWTDPDKSTKHKVVSTVTGYGVGKVFGKAADAAPDNVKKATVEAIGVGIDKAVGKEIDREMDKK